MILDHALKANENFKPEKAYELHIKAFEENPHLAKLIIPPDHPHYNYKYKLVEEKKIINCPLCKKEGKPYWAYNMITNHNFIEAFFPIRMWYYCLDCHHIFAHNYPTQIIEILKNNIYPSYLQPKITWLEKLSEIVSRIKKYGAGKHWFNIGFGAGEMLLLIKEYGFEVEGIDINSKYVDNFKYGINVYCNNFEEDDFINTYDVIIMEEVLEHFIDPKKAIKKASDMLVPNGILWISTPNFESAYSKIAKHNDPLRRVCEHINYFSYTSLSKLLVQYGFEIEDYQVSKIYHSCMEVIARKK